VPLGKVVCLPRAEDRCATNVRYKLELIRMTFNTLWCYCKEFACGALFNAALDTKYQYSHGNKYFVSISGIKKNNFFNVVTDLNH
jgi:hypothetical protein